MGSPGPGARPTGRLHHPRMRNGPQVDGEPRLVDEFGATSLASRRGRAVSGPRVGARWLSARSSIDLFNLPGRHAARFVHHLLAASTATSGEPSTSSPTSGEPSTSSPKTGTQHSLRLARHTPAFQRGGRNGRHTTGHPPARPAQRSRLGGVGTRAAVDPRVRVGLDVRKGSLPESSPTTQPATTRT
jgi:hypothetical protein